MMEVPTGKRELVSFSADLIEKCRVSVNMRAQYCHMMNLIAETGRYDGTKALINTLHKHIERTATHMFSPVELKFAVDFENKYPKRVYDQGAVAANVLRRQWERNNTDITFGRGVFEALKYGASILKQWVQVEGEEEYPVFYNKLVMPWQFGVYNEGDNDVNNQIAVCESIQMTMPEVWRRIYHLPEAKKLYSRIESHAAQGASTAAPQSYFHSLLSSSQLNTSGVPTNAQGGFIQINNGMNYSIMGPQLSAPTVVCHELWVKDEKDYTTIIMIEPDIIVAPLYKKANLLIADSQLQPYRLIQPNAVTNWFWGRSELVDLIEPQGLLATTCDDMRRLFGLQVDKILGFVGETGLDDERYGQFRSAGYVNLPTGSDIKDVTPKIPAEMLPFIRFLIETIDKLSGFPPIMQGAGEPGVRAGSHANTLMKTASPTLRDRALLVERQCADAADLTLAIREAKDPQHYWTMGDTPEDADKTKFLLADIPGDWRVTVDSHSSSPIFSDENTQIVVGAHKMGIVDGEYVIDNVALPNKESAKTSLRNKQKAQQEQLQNLITTKPDIGDKVLLKQMTGRQR